MAKSIFELDEFKPHERAWRARVLELSTRRAYYDGTIYRQIRRRFGDVTAGLGWGWLTPRLYKGIKPLYLPLSRAVDVDAGIIPGDWALPPVDDEPRAEIWQRAMDTVFDWSSWSTEGVLYVHYGAVYGLSGLKVCDAPEEGQVRICPMDPTTYMLVHQSRYSHEPALALIVEAALNDQGEPCEYAEVIEPDRIRTFEDGRPHGYDDREPEYPNTMETVPIVEVPHINVGMAGGAYDPYGLYATAAGVYGGSSTAGGECTYQKAIPLLNEVNELASYLADIVKKHAEPQWMVSGAEAGELVKSGDNVWFVPPGGDAKALIASVDVAGILAFIQEIRDQVYGALPELAFDDLRKKDQIATATLELQLMELVLKIKRCRPNYDSGLVRALRMAGEAGARLGLAEITDLADEELRFDDKRPVLPLDRKTELELEQLEQQVAFGRGDYAAPIPDEPDEDETEDEGEE